MHVLGFQHAAPFENRATERRIGSKIEDNFVIFDPCKISGGAGEISE